MNHGDFAEGTRVPAFVHEQPAINGTRDLSSRYEKLKQRNNYHGRILGLGYVHDFAQKLIYYINRIYIDIKDVMPSVVETPNIVISRRHFEVNFCYENPTFSRH